MTFLSTVYAERNRDRRERVRQEIAKREAVYAEFILAATRALAQALVSDLGDPELVADGQRLIGLSNRIGLFGPPDVMEEAEKVTRSVVEIWLKPGVDVRAAATQTLASNDNPLLPFSQACREDLDRLERTIPSLRR